MPIPAFNTDNVLPPHLGNPTVLDELSPFPCTTLELCRTLAISPERKAILQGFLNFRDSLRVNQISAGFQWLDGSFLEEIEKTQGRAPRDLDVVTFYVPTDLAFNSRIATSFPDFWDNTRSKAHFSIDHFPVDIGYNGFLTVEMTRYWAGLFSHRRDGVWKGMLRVDLSTPGDDLAAQTYLQALNP